MKLMTAYHAFQNLAKHNMSAIQPWCHLGGKEELWSIGIFSSISHRQPSRSVMLKLEVLILKFITIYALSWTKKNFIV